MMKSIRTLVRQDREKYIIPRRVQDVIPIQKIWEDGIFLTGGRYAKTFRFTDINYQVASEPDKEKMFRGYFWTRPPMAMVLSRRSSSPSPSVKRM